MSSNLIITRYQLCYAEYGQLNFQGLPWELAAATAAITRRSDSRDMILIEAFYLYLSTQNT